MSDYKEMYLKLFSGIENAVRVLQQHRKKQKKHTPTQGKLKARMSKINNSLSIIFKITKGATSYIYDEPL